MSPVAVILWAWKTCCLFTFKCDWISLVPLLGAEIAVVGGRKEHGIWIQENLCLGPGSVTYEVWGLEKTILPLPLLWFLYLRKIGIRGQIKLVRIKQCMWYCFINYIVPFLIFIHNCCKWNDWVPGILVLSFLTICFPAISVMGNCRIIYCIFIHWREVFAEHGQF